MKISYNAEADSLRIVFRDAPVVHRHITDGITAEYDCAGQLTRLEILNAHTSFGGPFPFGEMVVEEVLSALPLPLTPFPAPAEPNSGC